MELSVCVLPDGTGPEVVERFVEAERAGFRLTWTYDHLSWRSLRDGPWLAAVPLLAAAAGATTSLRLGTLVASPNFRHPVTLAKEAMTLDQLSGGRLDLGVGAGGTGADATVLGAPAPSPAERASRFEDFVTVLDALLREPALTTRTPSYAVDDARMLPGCVQQPRVPLTVAGAGPRALALAAHVADRWVTYGPVQPTATWPDWLGAVAAQQERFSAECRRTGRAPRRAVLLGLDLTYAQDTPAHYRRTVDALQELGVDDLVLHWPRTDPQLSGPSPDVWDEVLASVSPRSDA